MKVSNIEKEVSLLRDYLQLKNYSVATQRAYCSALRQFLIWRESEGLLWELEDSQARTYILSRYRSGKRWQTINGDYSALLKYYRYVKHLSWDFDNLPRPRKERQLPRIISKELVELLIGHACNLKHQVFMSLLYATGIRLGEALGIEIDDIDGDRRQIMIRSGKGKKDRYVDLPDCMLDMLRHYYKEYRPKKYLFNGKLRGQPLAPRSAQHLIKEACKLAGITKSVSPHTFRHCYATHHLENGSDLVYLKQQLGHRHLKTTAKYIHLMKEHSWRIHHPIASMKIEYHTRIS